jgi:type III pantothenate kinase
MNTLATALRITTSKLPEVDIKLPDSVIQNTTVGSIQSGIVNGYFGLFEGLISRVKKEIGDDRKVIATGGFASLIAENTHQIDIVDENLLLDGLQLLYGRLHPA